MTPVTQPEQHIGCDILMGVGTLCGGEALGGQAESAAGKAIAAAASVALSFCEKE